MYLSLKTHDFDLKHIILHEPVKNILKVGCEFIKIIYSNDLFVMNGLYISIELRDVYIENKNNYYKIRFVYDKNEALLKILSKIEEDLLGLLPNNLIKMKSLRGDKVRSLKVLNGDKNLKLGHNDILKCSLRIFGIWKDNYKCGLNYQYLYTTI
tara:strand:- start:7110 stop:7571 length:462 start_codon:yes stop_codon:yes gene_type:complete